MELERQIEEIKKQLEAQQEEQRLKMLDEAFTFQKIKKEQLEINNIEEAAKDVVIEQPQIQES